MSQAASQRRVVTNLTTGPIMKSLLLFAFPIVLTNLVQQLYSMVDLIVIGQYVGSVGTVGVNTGGEMADLVSPVAMGFATAGQIFIAQLVGAGDDRRIKRTVGTLLSFTTLLAVLLAAAAILFCRPILQLLNCPQEALFEAESYMIITALGYPFIFGYNAICGVLRGMGESNLHPDRCRHQHCAGHRAGGGVPSGCRRYGHCHRAFPDGVLRGCLYFSVEAQRAF